MQGFFNVSGGKLQIYDLNDMGNRPLTSIDVPPTVTEKEACAAADDVARALAGYGITGPITCSSTIDYPEDEGSSRETIAHIWRVLGWEY